MKAERIRLKEEVAAAEAHQIKVAKEKAEAEAAKAEKERLLKKKAEEAK